jgi:diacylglycerol O-acyltransferase
MNKLSLLDVAFFIAESEASPKHVGGLMICKRPARAKTSFAADLYREFLTFTDVQAPFNRIIRFSLTGMPSWQECDSVDLGSMSSITSCRAARMVGRSLYRLVSDLHQPMLDRSRPLVGSACHRRPERTAFCHLRQDPSCQRGRRDDDALGCEFAVPDG